ncbi:MAG: isoprenylcysteine carboxylmethyltransferase family protein [Phycisphaeraceae bacterium]|nr:isoprenylcysteine carboxylmethyltransferase family protein [Phycisphaeraceae bacterium]
MTTVSMSTSTPKRSSLVPRLATFAYGLFAYACFFATILYAIGFIGNWIVPKSIDSGVAGPIVPSLLINAALLAVFVVQHTVMARPAFKRWITRYIPASIERSTFVIAASASLGLAFWQWRPLPQVIWDVGEGASFYLLTALSITGWAIVFLSSFMVSHFDLFGLRQTWFRLIDRPYIAVGFRLVGLYKVVRHPLMLGFLIAFWATPVMTVGHLAFALLVTGYIFMGTWFEERDLIAEHGENYLDYRRRVRGLIPIPKHASK